MTGNLKRRLARLEQARGSDDDGELVEYELSAKALELLRECSPDPAYEPSEKVLVPRRLLRVGLSQAAREHLEEALVGLGVRKAGAG
jgi:hypothetical protein